MAIIVIIDATVIGLYTMILCSIIVYIAVWVSASSNGDGARLMEKGVARREKSQSKQLIMILWLKIKRTMKF